MNRSGFRQSRALSNSNEEGKIMSLFLVLLIATEKNKLSTHKYQTEIRISSYVSFSFTHAKHVRARECTWCVRVAHDMSICCLLILVSHSLIDHSFFLSRTRTHSQTHTRTCTYACRHIYTDTSTLTRTPQVSGASQPGPQFRSMHVQNKRGCTERVVCSERCVQNIKFSGGEMENT